ncbi:MAG: glycosyltransferase family 2 protein [Ktedonobacterales bacterium]
MWLLIDTIRTYDGLVLAYALLVCATYFFLLVVSALEVRTQVRARAYAGIDDLFNSPLTPGISLIAPAFNEEIGVLQSVRNMLNLRYPVYEVVIVNDGSRDRTLDVLKEAFQLRKINAAYSPTIATAPVRALYVSTIEPNLTIVDKENGGRADALNAGVNAARMPLVCCVDADSVLERDALLWVAKPFVEQPELVVASGGTIRIANGLRIDGGSVTEVRLPPTALPMFQVIEYMRAFLTGRTAWSRLNCLPLISGAFGLFRRDLMLEVGGFRRETIGEDAELIAHLHGYLRDQRRPYRCVFVPDAMSWTEAPETARVLRRQRARWHSGLTEVLWTHRRLIFQPRYGAVGLLAYPYFFLVEFLAPLIEGTGYLVFGASLAAGLLNVQLALLVMVVSVAYGVLITMGAVVLEEYAYQRYPRWRDLVRLSAFAVAENFGYRQLTVLWRLEGIWKVLRKKQSWGAMERRGLGASAVATKH